MNKTIIININGIVFHIEEDAYDVLRSYMTEVKQHFAYSPDSEEIVTDIENRLAEMFNERLAADNKQVIVLADVDYVTQRMGNVRDFDLHDPGDSSSAGSGYYKGKKLFRDTDDRVIGGVCSGIGHYFNVESRWIRLIAILSVLLGGSGLPIYAILWIIIPKAVTRADKMAMKGEPVNLQNLKKNFDEEVEGLKNGFYRAQKEARPAIDNLVRFIGSAAMAIIKIFISIITIACIVAMIALSIGLVTFLGYWDSNLLNIFPFNMVNPEYKSILTLSVFVTVFIPLAALVMFAIRVLFTGISIPRTVYFTMLIVWIAGIGTGIYHISRIASEFSDEAKFTVTTPLTPGPVYYIRVNPVRFLTRDDSLQYHIDSSQFRDRIIMSNRQAEFSHPRNVTLRIVRGNAGGPEIIREFSAKGVNFETALQNARLSDHNLVVKDSLIIFDGRTSLKKGELWRDQSVTLTLRVPENTRLKIEGKVDRYLEDYSVWECQPENSEPDYLSEWVMTASGLKCQETGRREF